jgi:hypothetical protein
MGMAHVGVSLTNQLGWGEAKNLADTGQTPFEFCGQKNHC